VSAISPSRSRLWLSCRRRGAARRMRDQNRERGTGERRRTGPSSVRRGRTGVSTCEGDATARPRARRTSGGGQETTTRRGGERQTHHHAALLDGNRIIEGASSLWRPTTLAV
jgi:hypothetical protein